MKRAFVKLEGLAPYSQSRYHGTPKLNKEAAGDYEERTWIEKAHWDEDGRLLMPALAFKNAIAQAAKYVSEQIPGKGKATYTKHFEAGVSVVEDSLVLVKGKPVTRDLISGDTLHVPSDGRRGGGSRVMRTFPTIGKGWEAEVEFLIFDDVITQDVFSKTLQQAGQLIGIGSFRVRNNGTRGRFKPVSIEWTDNYSL
ncbi:MAG: hypothetical protein ACRC62_09225 [Microcoleus sp.]